jgi:CBS domain-containing protein
VIRRDHRLETAERARQTAAALTQAAASLADAVHTLIPGCTSAVVVVEQGPQWTMLAQRGPVDVSRSWRRMVARHTRVVDGIGNRRDVLVAPIPSQRLHAMVVAVPIEGVSLPSGTRTIVQPLLDAAGILLDAAFDPTSSEGHVLRLVSEAS